jgi:hypothetical protein
MNHPQCFAYDIIRTYYSDLMKQTCSLQAGDINTLIKMTVCLLGLNKKSFPPVSISSHSLRAGGAMAMHLNKSINHDKICKQWRWLVVLGYISHVHS